LDQHSHLVSNGVYPHVEDFDGKAEVEEYIRALGIPASFYLAGFYMSNLFNFAAKDDSGSLIWRLPIKLSTLWPLIDIQEDTGKFVKAMIKHREQVLGKRVLGAWDYISIKDMTKAVKQMSTERTTEIGIEEVTPEAFKRLAQEAGMSPRVAQLLLESYQAKQDFGYFGKESLDWSHSILDEKLTSLHEYLLKELSRLE
jgi:hypothetical protein